LGCYGLGRGPWVLFLFAVFVVIGVGFVIGDVSFLVVVVVVVVVDDVALLGRDDGGGGGDLGIVVMLADEEDAGARGEGEAAEA
jgi:hypothetical protein